MRSAPKLVGATLIYGYLSWSAWKSLPSMDSHVSQVRTSISLCSDDAGQKRYERKGHSTQHEKVTVLTWKRRLTSLFSVLQAQYPDENVELNSRLPHRFGLV